MAKRWIQSVDVETDERGKLVFETVLATLAGDGLVFYRRQLAEAGGTVALIAGEPGKVARVHGLALVCSAQATLTIQDSDGGLLYVLGTFAANGGIVLDPVAMSKLAYAAAPAGKGLNLTVSAGDVNGYVLLATEDAA